MYTDLKNIKMKKIIAIHGMALLLASCGGGADKKAELEQLKKEAVALQAKIATLEAELNTSADSTSTTGIPVKVVALQSETFKNFITIQGRVDADENVSVSTGMPGIVTKIHVKVGDDVKQGQVLAETDAQVLKQNISDLQVNMDLATQLFERQKLLWENKVGTEMQYLQAKTNKESLEKKMSALKEQLELSTIVSPITGTIDAVDIKLGQLAAPGVPAIRVVNFSNLKVKAEIAESYASKIRKGNDVIIAFPDTQDSLSTKVNFVSRTINNSSRCLSLEVNLDDKKEYFPNMLATLHINDYQSAKPVIIVPVKTIQKDDHDEKFVYVANKNSAQKRIISTGKEYNGKVEVLNGLTDGDLLITEGYNIINNNDAIVVNK